MKKIFAVCFLVPLILSISLQGKAGVPDDNKPPKYAIINIFLRGMAKPKLFVIVDGKSSSIDIVGGYMDKEEDELNIFGALEMQLEKLGEMGYKLVSTSNLSPSLLTYTLVKQ